MKSENVGNLLPVRNPSKFQECAIPSIFIVVPSYLAKIFYIKLSFNKTLHHRVPCIYLVSMVMYMMESHPYPLNCRKTAKLYCMVSCLICNIKCRFWFLGICFWTQQIYKHNHLNDLIGANRCNGTHP